MARLALFQILGPGTKKSFAEAAGGVIDGTETIDAVGKRVFDHVCKVASGDEQAKAEVHKHREFQFWAEQTVSL